MENEHITLLKQIIETTATALQYCPHNRGTLLIKSQYQPTLNKVEITGNLLTDIRNNPKPLDVAVGYNRSRNTLSTAFGELNIVLTEDLPEDWVCPECGVGKDQFEPA